MKKVKRVLSLAAIGSLTLFLAACSNKPVTSHSTGLWDHYIVYNFSRFIIWLSNNYLYDHHPDHLTAIDVLPNEVNAENSGVSS